MPDSNGFNFSIDGNKVVVPWRTILGVLMLLGLGGFGVSAGGGYMVKGDQTGTRDQAHEEILTEVKAVDEKVGIVDAKVGELGRRSKEIREDVNYVGRRQDDVLEDINRIKARDKKRDKILKLDERLKDAPIDPPKAWRRRGDD